jgi:hypothetical protein
LNRLYLVSIALLPCLLCADGGALRIRVRDGNMIIGVFTSPVPLRVGAGDISILMQNAADQNPILDGAVTLRLSLPDHPEIAVSATHEQATNKLLYAATVNLPAAGEWALRVNCKAGLEGGTVITTLAVLPKQPPFATYWPYFALVPLGLSLFVLNQWLKAKRLIKQ